MYDATSGDFFIHRGYHQPSSQHFCVDMTYYCYGNNYKSTVYKTWIVIDMVIFINLLFTNFWIFWNSKAFLPQA